MFPAFTTFVPFAMSAAMKREKLLGRAHVTMDGPKTAHYLRGNAEKVRPILPVYPRLIHEA